MTGALSAMPPDTARERRQMAWAAAALVFGGAPHLFAVEPWVALLVLGIACWRIVAAERGWRLPSLWLRVPVTVLAFLAVVMTYHSISGVEAGSALLLVMGGMKLLETRDERDRILVVFIALFLLFAVFLREQAIWSAAWLAGGCLGIGTALVQTVRRGPLLPLPQAVLVAGRLLLQGLPLAVVLFVLFPRIPGPFWAMPDPQATGRSGLAEEIQPGDISALGLSDEVAFRVRFEGAVPATGALYWRGPVLERFDGRGWSALPGPRRVQGVAPPAGSGGREYGYQLVLEPQGKRWLLALETPLQWSAPRAVLSPAMQLLSAEPYWERLSYHGRSVASGIAATPATPQMLAANLRLPPGRNPRTLALARQLRADAAGDGDFMRRALALFRNDGFRYSLTPPRLGQEAVDDFLFETRTGFCEHYASALAVLARAAGIPARVIAGYQGGDRNPFGDYWIVRQANAHAWVEVWMDGAWHRIDPTAAVAPERIENGIEETMARAGIASGRLWRSSPFVNRMVLSWDAANAAWDRWVLAFGPETQDDLLLALGFEVPRTMQLALLAGLASTACLLLLGFALHRQGRRQRDRVVRLYARLCRRLEGCVRPPRPGETAQHYAAAVAAARPDLAADVQAMTELYLRLRYGGSADAAGEHEFRQRLRGFRPARA
ncbi:Protein-glutamine gamma-glutamyltransferase [Gammaproteobacteria bacterium]|nr:Protein-glutamine gamma-glutamyltransferase [Gammaproteobacteria bacterium]